MLIKETQVKIYTTVSKVVLRLESCSEYTEQEIFQMLQDGRAKHYFDDQIFPHMFVSELNTESNPIRRIAALHAAHDAFQNESSWSSIKESMYSSVLPNYAVIETVT